jgi:predicted phosphate transport protein (TIGR00153 family)
MVFFDCFEDCIKAGVKATALLQKMLATPAEFQAYLPQIEAFEKEGDDATAKVIDTLNKNLATPFDRSDIRALMESLDDILDACDTVAHKLLMYRAQNVRPEAHELARILALLAPATEKAVVALRTGRTADLVLGECREVHQLENEADKVLRRGIGALFDEIKDPIELIKWKEILEILEHATDNCEDAVRVIEEVVRKHA